jgi:hypothetical protein
MATCKISMDAITPATKSRASMIVRETAQPESPEAITETRPVNALTAVRDRLREMSVLEKIEWARYVSTQLELHMDLFPQSPVLYGDLHAFANDLQARLNETQIGLGHWKMLASFEAHQEALVDKAMARIAQYVQSVSEGDEIVVKLSGLRMTHPEKPTHEQLALPVIDDDATEETPRQVSLKWVPSRAHALVMSDTNQASALRKDSRMPRRKV